MTKIVNILGCIAPNADPNQTAPIRVCHMPAKVLDEKAKLDLTDCKLELSGMDISDFKVCPFCVNPLYKEPLIKNAGETKVYQTRVPSGELIPISYIPNRENDSAATWLVGMLLNETIIADQPFAVVNPVTIQTSKDNVISALKSMKAYNEGSFGIYTVIKE